MGETLSDLAKDIQPYAALISAVLSVGMVGLLVNLLRLSREAAQDRLKVWEDRLAFAKEDQERDKKWYEREKTQYERDLADRQRQIEGLLKGAGLDLSALAIGEGIRALADDAKQRLAALNTQLQEQITNLPAAFADAGAAAQLTLAKGRMAVGEWPDAAASFDQYTLHESDADWETQFTRGVAHANARLGSTSDTAALRAYNDAIALAPNDLDPNWRARLHGYRGAILKRLFRLDQAEADLRIAQKLATAEYEIGDVLYNLACVFAMSGRRDEMLNAVRGLTDRNPAFLRSIRHHMPDYFARYNNDPDLQRLLSLTSRYLATAE